METIDLSSIPQADAKSLLASGVPVYLLVNPVEFHGPHLPLGNDHNLSLCVSHELHAHLQKAHPDWPFVLATPLHIGTDAAPGHGSVNVHFQTVRKLVLESCRALEVLGARRVLIMTFHGSPFHGAALQAGVRYLRSRGIASISPFNLVMREVVDYRPGKFEDPFKPIQDPKIRAQISRELAEDFHAGFFETSLALHYCPETVSPVYRDLPGCPTVHQSWFFRALSIIGRALGLSRFAAEARLVSLAISWSKLKPFPGYTGFPHLANAQSGKAFAQIVLDSYIPHVEEALDGSHSGVDPMMGWLLPLTLQGRITL